MAESISREFIALLLAKVDIVDLVHQQIPLRKKSGNNYFACCPFHNEKTASFSVSQAKQFYHCFGCGAHGNAIDFLIQRDRLNFPEAIETLARQVGMEIPQQARISKKEKEFSEDLYGLTQRISDYYYQQLRHSTIAIDYLKNRGISGAIAKQFCLGYAPKSWSTLSNQFGKSETDYKNLLSVGVIVKKSHNDYYDRFRDRIMFPIHDYRGRVIGFGGRILDQGEPKYLNSPETPLFQKGHELYGLFQVLNTNRQVEQLLIVEGYMDVIALFQHGITFAVATLGTATTPHHIKRLTRYTNKIIFCFDGDQAGRVAAWRALQVLLPLMKDNLEVHFLFLPDGEDPDSLVRKEGKAVFMERIQKAASLTEFFFQTLQQDHDTHSLDAKARYAAQALNLMKEIPPGLLQTVLVEELHKRTRIDINELKKRLQQTTHVTTEQIIPNTPKKKVKWAAPVRLLIALLIQQPNLIELIKEALPSNNLPGLNFLADIIELIQPNPNITTGALIEHWRDQPEQSLIVNLATWQHLIPQEGIQTEFLGALRQLKILSIEQEIAHLLDKANTEGLQDQEKLYLSQQITQKKTLTDGLIS